MNLRATLPFAAGETLIGVFGSYSAAVYFVKGAPLVAALMFLLSIAGYSLAVHMTVEADR